ncbi:MAG TPA: DUF6503 family protein [Saprospiraceae bacterium]|nr:DUF6503 family protein [Saprospiraceae bacterium]
MKRLHLLATLLLFTFCLPAQEALIISAPQLLEKSITYHDPDGNWGQQSLQWRFYESRPDNSYRISDMYWNPQQDVFQLTQQIGRDQLYRAVEKGACTSKINGFSEISAERQEKYRLNCERNTMYRNYYTYLWGLPMKLKDPGTVIDPQVKQKDFFGKELYEIRVTYEAEVGADIWYFYFDPGDFSLQGYRFYHDEAKNDGEYILLDGEVRIDGLRIPAQRTWYTHQEDRLLGTDELVLMQH